MRDGERRAPPRESRALRIFLIIWIPFSLVVLALIGWTVYDLRGLFPYAKHIVDSSPRPTRSLESIEILLQSPNGNGTRLSIPAAYMQWTHNRKGGLENTIIALRVLYPEMTPFALLSPEEENTPRTMFFPDHNLRYDSLVHINMAVPNSIELLLSGETGGKYTSFLGEANEFLHYRKHVSSRYYDYLIPIGEPKSPSRVFECAGMSKAELANADQLYMCSMHVQFSDRLQIDYAVPRSELGQWRRVDRQMIQLIRTFVVDCFEGPLLTPGQTPQSTHPCRDNLSGTE